MSIMFGVIVRLENLLNPSVCPKGMSGPICPDCSQSYFERVTGGKQIVPPPFDRCTFCGWIGDVAELGRKELVPQMEHDLSDERALKGQGAFFYVRVYFKEKPGETADKVREILSAHGGSNSHSAGKHTEMIYVGKKPTAEQLKKIKAISGVILVEVW